jgi:hypothetical protein
MVAAYSRGATKAGKEISVLSFCHYPHQENLMIESFKELEKNDIPMLLVHKSQPGDWDPYRGPNNVMLHTSSRGMMLFDGVGEYWGGSRIPYCFPEEIQYRLKHALQNNRNLYSVAVRVFDFFDYGTLFGNYNEVNFYAVSRLVENPSASTEHIWQEWAGKKFGKEAAPQMIEILKRSDEIGKLVYYFNGIWVQQHSLIAELNYMKAQVLHTGRAMLDWYPDRLIENGMIQEFMFRPNETLIQEAVGRREYALHLCNQSIRDAKSTEKWLSRDEYLKLTRQLEVQRKFAEVSKSHIEAYLRYVICQNDPGNQENIKRLILVLASLDKLAKEIDETWQEKERLLSGKRIRGFVNDVKKECHI